MAYYWLQPCFSVFWFLWTWVGVGVAIRRQDPEGHSQGIGTLECAVLGLLGLLLAFTFSGAATRFEDRRLLIAEESNSIGTAYLRIDVLPLDVQPAMRNLFRQYVDKRLQVYAKHGQSLDEAAFDEANILQSLIWAQAIAAAGRQDAPSTVAMLMLPALNEMIDITTTRAMSARNHPPTIIFILLALLSLVSAVVAGYGMAGSNNRQWTHAVIFALMLSATFYVILDLEYPRLGLITIEAEDVILIGVRKSMGP